MTVRDICGVVENICEVYDRVVYYEDIHEYGVEYLGEFSDIKDEIMDFKVCRIYPLGIGINIEIISNGILHTKAKIVDYSGKYVNNMLSSFKNISLSSLVCKNADVNYICYGVSSPRKREHGRCVFCYEEFMNEIRDYEKSVTNGRHGKIIMAFYYNLFFRSVFNDSGMPEKMLKNYMISNGWVFDSDIDLVYKIIVL